jgi:hypothetical protein
MVERLFLSGKTKPSLIICTRQERTRQHTAEQNNRRLNRTGQDKTGRRRRGQERRIEERRVEEEEEGIRETQASHILSFRARTA